MSRKILAKLIAASFALAGIDAAMACSTTAWANTGSGGGEQGNPVEGQPDQGVNAVARYSGICGLRAPAAANYVRDVSPAAEPSYRARFYVYTGTTGAGEALVFRASDAGNAPKIRVSYDSGAGAFKVYSPAASATVPGVLANRWYSVELNFANSGTPGLRYTIRGANSTTPLANDLAIAGVAGTDVIDTADLGWVDNVAGAPAGAITTDAFESRRNTAIGRLCRGDADNNGSYGVQDRIAMTNEILRIQNGQTARALATGQPDCDENGSVGVTDRICVTNFIIAVPARTCSST